MVKHQCAFEYYKAHKTCNIERKRQGDKYIGTPCVHTHPFSTSNITQIHCQTVNTFTPKEKLILWQQFYLAN
jgi:hypothetical protein